MKKFLAVILSFHLITVPVSFAQSSPTYEQASARELQNGSYDFYAKQILQLATSVIGANILTQCPTGFRIPSIATFMAGSIVHIASEFAAAREINQNHNKRMDQLRDIQADLQNNQGGELQKFALEQRLQEEKDSVKFVKSRILWTAAVSVIYATAAGLAIAEQIGGMIAAATAGAATCAPLYAAAAVPFAGLGAIAAAAACTASIPAGTSAAQASISVLHTIPSTPPQPGGLACSTVYQPSCTTSLSAYLTIAHPQCRPLRIGSGLLGRAAVMGLTSLYSWAQGRTAQGAQGTITSMGTMIVTMLPQVVSSLQNMIAATYNYPIPRSIAFGAAGVLSGAITVGLNQRKNLHEENVKKLEQVIANFRLTTENDSGGVTAGETDYTAGGANGGTSGGTTGRTTSGAASGATSGSGNGSDRNRPNCLSSSGESSAAACSNPARVAAPNFAGLNIPEQLQKVGNLANELANAVAAGNTERANLLAGQIGNMAGRVHALNKELLNRLNKQRAAQKEKKEKPLDFDKSVKDQVAALQGEFNKAASANGMGAASLGNNPSAPTATEEKSAEATAAPGGAGGGPEMLLPSGGEGMPSEELPVESATKDPTLDESLNEFESAESDIVKDNTVSIFKQVSNRYLLNYTRFFNRKEIEPPLKEPAKKAP